MLLEFEGRPLVLMIPESARFDLFVVLSQYPLEFSHHCPLLFCLLLEIASISSRSDGFGFRTLGEALSFLGYQLRLNQSLIRIAHPHLLLSFPYVSPRNVKRLIPISFLIDWTMIISE